MSARWFAACFAFAIGAAHAQTVLQTGPWTPRHAPSYSPVGGTSIPQLQDSGPAGGGSPTAAPGLSEGLFIVPPLPGQSGPFQSSGTGPLNTNICDYDAALTNPAGYHYLCVSPNILGIGTIAYGAGGGAAAQPFQFYVNGSYYQFPFAVGGIVGPGSTTSGDIVLWNNALGTLVSDGGVYSLPNIPGTLTAAKGGTGAVSLSGYLFGHGSSAATASTTIPTTALSGTVPASQGGLGATSLTGYLFGNGSGAATASTTVPTTSLSGTISGAQLPTFTGDVTNSAAAMTISANAVTNADLAQMAADSVKCNNIGSLANAADCTVAQTNALLGVPTATNVLRFQALAGVTAAAAVCRTQACTATGTGYGTSATGTMTLTTGGGFTCSTYPVLNVTTNAGGNITTVNSVVTAGSCTAIGAMQSETWTKGGALSAGSGALFALTWTATAQTYTASTGVKEVKVWALGAAGQGGGGANVTSGTASSGGSGGGGGYENFCSFPAATVGASQTITVGLGGRNAGLPGTTAPSNGTVGQSGGASTFGTLCQGEPGGGGFNGIDAATNSGGGGGAGLNSAGGAGTSGTGGTGTQGGATGGAGAVGTSPSFPVAGASGGGALSSGASAAGGIGFGGGAGGGTGGGLTAGPATATGGAGGAQVGSGSSTAGGVGGTANNPGAVGVAPSVSINLNACSGAGGGGSSLAGSAAGDGGVGCNGSGGGGGGSYVGGASGGGGFGGPGGDGEIDVVEYF